MQTIKLPDIYYKRRGEHLHPRDQGRTQRGLARQPRQRRGYSLSARQRRGYNSWDQQKLRASLAWELCWSGFESLGYFHAQLWIFIINHLVQCRETSTELFRKISQLSQQIYIYYINHPLEKDWVTILFLSLLCSEAFLSALQSFIYNLFIEFKL